MREREMRGIRRVARRRRLAAVCAALALAVVVAACTGQPASETHESTASSTVSSTAGADSGSSTTESPAPRTSSPLTSSAPSPTGTGDPSARSSDPTSTSAPPPIGPASAKQPAGAAVVWGKTAGSAAVAMSSAVFGAAPVVVLCWLGDGQAMTQAAEQAPRIGAPMLLAGGSVADQEATTAEIGRLGAGWLLACDSTARDWAERIDGVRVTGDPADLPTFAPPAAEDGLTVLVPAEPISGMAGGLVAGRATASAVGARIQPVRGGDPRGDPDAIAALAKDPPAAVIGFGPDFGPPERLAARVATAATGVQLPGGGQLMFPGRTLVALYGHPSTGALGALGQQSLPAAIDRAKKVAADYTKLAKTPVVPTFEIIATIAAASAGRSGLYSSVSSVASLKPWVTAATNAGMYVILDLQPGRAHLLDQAKLYTELLRMPAVGLALDPEWKLGPGQLPLQQIGGVDASEINKVIDWLGDLTATNHLPQKVLVLHQFRLSMLRNESQIDTGNDNVSVLIHMDGQGSPGMKEATWQAVISAAPKGVEFGWKNFYVKDTPTMTPQKTMARKPVPVMISYQ